MATCSRAATTATSWPRPSARSYKGELGVLARPTVVSGVDWRVEERPLRLAAGARHRAVADLALLVQQLGDALQVLVAIFRGQRRRAAHDGVELVVGEG